jgi:hypothetical protein
MFYNNQGLIFDVISLFFFCDLKFFFSSLYLFIYLFILIHDFMEVNTFLLVKVQEDINYFHKFVYNGRWSIHRKQS